MSSKNEVIIRLIDRPTNSQYAWWEISINGQKMLQGVSEEDCRYMRCSERDFLENCARDLIDRKGLNVRDFVFLFY